MLRHTPLQSIRRVLREFPNALGETYERTLRVINEKTWEYAHRIFQCLTVSARPLLVEELAEVFTIELNADSTGIPELNAGLRHRDAEEAVLSAGSSLVAVVRHPGERIVQFSHFSVQQFLTSDRIANTKDVSNFHVLLELAHTFLARICLSILLQQDERKEDDIHYSPLHSYAAKHWVGHARFGNVSSIIQEGMERLFDKDRPHFIAWIGMYNLDYPQEAPLTSFAVPVSLYTAPVPLYTVPVPLYYTALCGFYDLAERLLVVHPQDVNAIGGRCVTPLLAALDKGHVNIAQLLLQHGADVNVRDGHDRTPLHLAAECGNPGVLRSLINRGANPNAQDKDQETPLFLASRTGRLEAAQLLSEHGIDMNFPDFLGRTPLHVAAENGHCDIALLLLNCGADVNAPEQNLRTPLHLVADQGKLAVAKLLLEHDAKVDARDGMDCTPIHFASQQGHLELLRLLSEHGADVFARDNEKQTALHKASEHGGPEVVRWLIERGVDPSAEDEDQETPLFPASRNGKLEATQLLLQAKAYVDHRDWQNMTPLHGASENGHHDIAHLLLTCGADVNAKHMYDWTPLHLASRTGKSEVAEVLLDGGAMVNAQNDSDWTPLHMASQKGYLVVVQLLLDNDADVNTKEADGETALHLAAFYGHLEVAQELLEDDADLWIENREGETPFNLASKERHHDIVELLELYRDLLEERHLDVDPDEAQGKTAGSSRKSPVIATDPPPQGLPPTVGQDKIWSFGSTLRPLTEANTPTVIPLAVSSTIGGLPESARLTTTKETNPEYRSAGQPARTPGAPRPYACDICGKTYAQRQGLNRHHRDVHTSPNSCSFCGMKWIRPYLYKEHLIQMHREVDPDMVLRKDAGSRRRTAITGRHSPKQQFLLPPTEHDWRHYEIKPDPPMLPPIPILTPQATPEQQDVSSAEEFEQGPSNSSGYMPGREPPKPPFSRIPRELFGLSWQEDHFNRTLPHPRSTKARTDCLSECIPRTSM